MLDAKNIIFRYSPDSPWLFNGFSMAVSPGEVVGLQGPSGRGKSTLARILCGYLPPHSGTVAVDGRSGVRNGFNPVQLLFQHPELSVDPRWKIGEIIQEGHTPTEAQLAAFDIDPGWLGRYPCELSGGQISRICLVRALSPEVKFLVADEITTMLDALTQARLWKSLLHYSEENRLGILVISHDEPLLKRLCHRIIELH